MQIASGELVILYRHFYADLSIITKIFDTENVQNENRKSVQKIPNFS